MPKRPPVRPIAIPSSAIISDDELIDVAVRAEATVASVLRRLVGLPVRGRVSARIDAILSGAS